jgi:hypothetical protein
MFNNQLSPYEPSALARKIEDTEREIHRQEATIASLTAEGHVVTDAARQLNELLRTLAGLVRERMKVN